ncbi:hypothetical protein LTR53_010377 [Teratosphaeriaceae sp. CCFEE 6253]|nr:hypothetical protein LTR53_010377 [Teratosphaeriaceae sp. CCFEE 6253]
MSSQFDVYTGVWVDQSSGSTILGLTATLSARDGALLVAFLATFVTFVGGKVWKIIRYVSHQIRARKQQEGAGALFNQQQVILRNSTSPGSAIVDLARSSLAWRRTPHHASHGTNGLMLLAILDVTLFAVAGLLSSRASNSTHSVLLSGRGCGGWAFPTQQASQSQIINETITAAAYARNCYNTPGGSLRCGTYIEMELPWTAENNASCPFSAGMCIGGDNAAYSMDTGHMDSHDALGINTAPAERISYRKRTICAPLHSRDREALREIETPNGTTQVDVLSFGSTASGLLDYTYQYAVESLRDGFAYALNTFIASPGQLGVWQPIQEVDRTDADVSIFFLNQNSIRYDAPVYDPLFLTENQTNAYDPEMSYIVGYYYTSTLGCVDQHQYCISSRDNPGSEARCTGLTDHTSATAMLSDLPLTDTQLAVSKRMTANVEYQNTHYAVYGRGASALRANELVRYGDSALYGTTSITSRSLPDDQWQREVSSWFATSMARLQQNVVGYAIGPLDLGQDGELIPPDAGSDQTLCRQQKVKNSDGYVNFNILAIVIILVIGSILVLTGLTIDTVGGYLQRRTTKHSFAPIAWELDNKLQLQRMAYEGAGWGTGQWADTKKAVPVFHENLVLGRYETRYYGRIELAPKELWTTCSDSDFSRVRETGELRLAEVSRGQIGASPV